MIEALENVIKDFNQKITEQFGENFKQLNEAVGALLDWQKEYKEQVSLLTQTFEECKKSISEVKDSIVEIEGKTSTIPEHMTKLKRYYNPIKIS